MVYVRMPIQVQYYEHATNGHEQTPEYQAMSGVHEDGL